MEETAADVRLEEICAFVDANILIHFDFLNEIDWPKVLGAKCVCLAFPRVIFKELDDMKDGMTKPGRREKARRVLKVIGEPLEAADLDTPVPLPKRANTSIMYVSDDDLSVDPALRYEKQDDQLIAALLNYRAAHPDANLVLLSDDFNCRQRAKRFGIAARTLPEDLRRPLPLTEEEEELKKLRVVEPQVEVEFGAEGDELRLPYNARRGHYYELAETYERQVTEVAAALAEDYKAARGEQPQYAARDVYRQRQEPRNLKDEDLGRYNSRDQRVIRAVKALELDVYAEWLTPVAKVVQSWNGEPTPASKAPFDLWKSNVERLRKLAESREHDLHYAFQALHYYALPITFRHSGGTGLADGRITIEVSEPLEFQTFEPKRTEDQNYSYRHQATKWLQRPTKPSDTYSPPHVRTFEFGNLHPGSTVECDLIYIHAESQQSLKASAEALHLTVEVSGLNMRKPFRRVVKIRVA